MSGWASRLPQAITFLDVETTGLGDYDRVVSLGAVKLNTALLSEGQLIIEHLHLVFRPDRKSAPKARETHGYEDEVLERQERFKVHAETIWKFIHRASVFAGHNVGFDARFMNREFAKAKCPLLNRPLFCTMEAYRARDFGGSAKLDTVCRELGLRRRRGKRHGALEDAWLAMSVYLLLHGCPFMPDMPDSIDLEPVNLRK